MRERNRRLRAWNSNTLNKWWGLGVKMRHLEDESRGMQLMDYWTEATKQSAWGKAFRQVVLEFRQMMQTQPDPASPDFDAAIQRIREICAEHALGDALTFTEWRRFTRHIYGPYMSATEGMFDPEWEFIERALQARENKTG
jgi:hypothetical protein